jgi:glutathione S-transferase
MELYHYGFSTCSQKVRLVLAEKDLAFESHEIDLIAGEQHRPDYVKLNPNHVVPTLVHEGRVFLESTLILRYVEDAFPDTPIRPRDLRHRYEDDLWLKRIDEKLHPAAPVVTFAVGPRNVLLQQPEAVREANIAAIPDPDARAVRRSVIERGVEAPEFAKALRVFITILDTMESDLQSRPWLSGERPGFADASALPYVLRLEHLSMDPLIAARPAVAHWLSRWKARPGYATAVDAWLAPAAVELLRTNGQAVWPDVQKIAAAPHAD